MINELILDAFKKDRIREFEQKGYSVSNVLTNPYGKVLCFHVYVPYEKKRFGDKIATEVYTVDLGRSNHYGIILPYQYVKAELRIKRWDYTSDYYSVTYNNIVMYDEIPFVSQYGYEVHFKPYSVKDCAYMFEQFMQWDYHRYVQINLIDTKHNLLTFGIDSDLEPITRRFTVTNLPSTPNLEFTFERIDVPKDCENPSRITCTYHLVNVSHQPLIYEYLDKSRKAKTDEEKEDLKDNCSKSCIFDFSKRPKVTVTFGDQTHDFTVEYSESEIRNRFGDYAKSNDTEDPVNHPNHYEMVGPFESFDIIVESLGIEEARYFCQGNIIKYQTRYRQKNGEEDLKKRHWYSRMDQMLAKCKTIEDYYKLKESDF